MTILMYIFCVAISAFLVAIFILAWLYDIKLSRFRSNVQIGQPVTYFQVYKSENDYGNGIVTNIDKYGVTVISDTLEEIQISKRNIYPANF